jgi:D-alanine-D-alanine ligase
VIYDGGAESWGPEDIRAVLVSAKEVQSALAAAGHEVTRVAVRPDLAWFQIVRGCDLVFNLCEGIEGVSALEIAVASAIDLTGIPYTGCSAWTSTICHRKPVLNSILQAHGLPIPRWHLIDGGPLPNDWPLPSIVKPAAEDASIGIEQTSVVETRKALEGRIREVQEEHGGVLLQRYVAGREIAVGFVGDHILPLSEIDFTHMPDGAWPIVSFSAKWHEESPEYSGTEPVCPAAVDEELAGRIIAVATAAWRIVEGRGYGRVDLRVDVDGQPWVLEVNPNPDLSMNAGLARMARAYGWSHEALVNEIVQAAFDGPVAQAPGTRPPASAARSPQTASLPA